MKDNIVKALVSVFGLGYMPVGPGTWGSFGGLLLWYFYLRNLSTIWYVAVLVVLIIVSCYLSDLANKIYGEEDSSHIVIDEVCGFLVSMICIQGGFVWGLAGFILFRVFDILKPQPVKFFEDLHGGIGVVLDDVMAGVYAALILNFIRYVAF